MIDMFSILVIYLLMNFSATGEIFFIQKNLKLPEAKHAHQIESAPLITVTAGAVTLETENVGDNPIELTESDQNLPRLSAALRKMKQLDEACVKTHKTSFMSATPAQRTQLLETLDRDAKSYMDGKKAEQPPHYFRMMKELSLVGYFTSEIGYTKALRYKESPGPFQPCVPYTAGEPIWARHA